MRVPLTLTLALVAVAAPFTTGDIVPLRDAPQAQAVHHVHMITDGALFRYDPAVLLVSAGDSVVFHSHDSVHTATSGLSTETESLEVVDQGTLGLNKFDTGRLFGGSSASVAFGASGTFAYYCKEGFHRHFGMHGVIQVG